MNKTKSDHSIIDNFIAPECKDFVKILYQDADILLINKPSGLLSLSGKNPLNWDSVHHRLVHGQENFSPPLPLAKIPHRLDLGTSGVMVVALNTDAAKNLNRQFQERKIQKHYTAILDGWINENQGRFSAAIAKDKDNFPRVKICELSGKAATSEYQVLQRLEQPRRCKVKYSPLTGRTHQLRIHSLAMGHPILGCDLYQNDHSEAMADRLQLHASDLFFQHPTTGKPFHGHSPCPF